MLEIVGISGASRFRSKDRRLAPSDQHLLTCRLCFRPIEWRPEHLEHGELHIYYRCPECGGSFPIRHSDVATMVATEDHTSGAAPA